MVNGTRALCARAFDFGGQGLNPCIQFQNRQRVQIFTPELCHEITGADAGRGVFKVHRKHGCADGERCQRLTEIVEWRGLNMDNRLAEMGEKLRKAPQNDMCRRSRGSKRGYKIMAMPESMRAIAISAPGGPDVLEEQRVPVPVPGHGQVLIEVAAAGVNRPDILQRQGRYPVPPGASSLPGLEVAGRIAAVGPGTDPSAIGRRVCALVAGGGYAEYVAVDYAHCFPLPPELSAEVAAAIPETLMTVWHNLFERAYVADGDTVLVHGGTSGIGTMAIALCRLFDVNIIVTCGSDEKCSAALEWGATHAINYRTQDFVAEVDRLTGGVGVTAVLDMVGGDYLPRNLACLAEDGRHVSIAVLGGAKTELFIPMMMTRRLTLTGSTLRPRTDAFKAMLVEELMRTVWPSVCEGSLRPTMDRVYPLAEAAEAHRRMEAGDHIGKIVLKVR
jgi:NADPH2:quinone reductase